MQPVRGTRDVLDSRKTLAIKEIFESALKLSNFNQIFVPILEHAELFKKSVGQSSDIVSKEMFFTAGIENKDDFGEICLRPELTTSIIRAYSDFKDQTRNFKCFTWGQCFRRERPQKGRLREFNQLSVEIIDAKSYFFDVELIELFYKILVRDFELNDFWLEINYLSGPEDRAAYREELVNFLEKQESSLCQNCNTRRNTNPLRCFDCKNKDCSTILQQAPLLFDSLSEAAKKESADVKNALIISGVDFIENPRLVRGLDYYQGLVFEFKTGKLGAQNTFCAGGRYNIGKIFNKSLPSVGLGLGLERMELLLEEQNINPYKRTQGPVAILTDGTAEASILAQKLSQVLVDHRIKCQAIYDFDNFGKGLSLANKLNAGKAILIGSDEISSGQLTIKDMASGKQTTFSQANILNALKE